MFGKSKRIDGRAVSGGSDLSLAHLQEQNMRLQQAVQQLSLLNDLAQTVGLSDSSEQIIKAIVACAKQALEAEQVMIYFIERTGEQDIFKTKVRDKSSMAGRAFHFDEALRWMMEQHRAPFLTNDPHHEPRLQNVALDRGLRSLLCVPLLVRGELTGLVAACNKGKKSGFTAEDQRLLAIMANQSAQVLETTRLRENEALHERLQRDILMARQIQTHLLPDEAPRIPGYDIAGCSMPAELIGGDYFDYIPLADGRLGICLGDVSGKGVPAALLMANLQATLRGQAGIHGSACECLKWANRLLFHSTGPDKFATLFYCILDPRTHELVYCNAGHERPLLMSDVGQAGGGMELTGGGLVLGVLEDFEYQERCCTMEPGALLLIFSDGLTDAVDGFDRPFGEAGIARAVAELQGASAQQVLKALLNAVKAHTAGAPAFDDVTIIAIRRHE